MAAGDPAEPFVVTLTDEERSALVWALEAARALLFDDPHLSVLAAEQDVAPDLLDELADGFFMAGCVAAARE